LNFAAGQTTASFTVPALTDSILESSPETVNLVLLGGNVGSTPSILRISDVPPAAGTTVTPTPTGTTVTPTPTGTTVTPTPTGTTPTAATTVPNYFFGATNYSVTEGSSAPITIFRGGNVSAPSAITFSTGGGSAKSTGSQVDYSSVFLTVNFVAGQTSAQVPVLTANDPLTEPTETVGLFLSGGSVASPSVALLSIFDNTPVPPPSFSYAQSSVSISDNTTGTVTINRTGNTSVSASVDYFILPDPSAPAYSTDYTITNPPGGNSSGGTVSFIPGQTSVSLTINNPLGLMGGNVSFGFGPNTNIGTQGNIDITLI
jgi:hypothetical protein